MAKTSKAAMQAVARYNKRFDRVAINLPKGTAAAVRAQGVSVSRLVCELVASWLDSRGVEVIESDLAPINDGQNKPNAPQAAQNPMEPRRENNIHNDNSTAHTAPQAPAGGDNYPDIIDIDSFI